MAVLICRFASDYSAPEKINRWITYLEELREKHIGDQDTVEIVDRLLCRARQWLGAD